MPPPPLPPFIVKLRFLKGISPLELLYCDLHLIPVLIGIKQNVQFKKNLLDIPTAYCLFIISNQIFFNIIGYQSLPVVCLRLPSRKQIIGSGKVQEGAAWRHVSHRLLYLWLSINICLSIYLSIYPSIYLSFLPLGRSRRQSLIFK